LLLALLFMLFGWLPLTRLQMAGDGAATGGATLAEIAALLTGEVIDAPVVEIVDEPLEEIVDDPVAEDPPSEDGAAVLPPEDTGSGGVVGGGVSEGPTEAPPPTATSPPLPPPTTVPPTAESPPVTSPPPVVAPPSPTPLPPTATATPTPVPAALRLDEPVLRWLPELEAAAAATGVPVPLLAAVARVTSGGDPNVIALDGARGLLGVPPTELAARGVPEASWHDPAANALVGAQVLAAYRDAASGDWVAALTRYVGDGCDPYGVCAADYGAAIQQWTDYYAAVLADPARAGLAPLPANWTPPVPAPYQETTARPLAYPPGGGPPPTATPTPVASPPPTASDVATPVAGL